MRPRLLNAGGLGGHRIISFWSFRLGLKKDHSCRQRGKAADEQQDSQDAHLQDFARGGPVILLTLYVELIPLAGREWLVIGECFEVVHDSPRMMASARCSSLM